MPSFSRLLVIACAALLVACASVVHGPDRAPTAAEIVGIYDMGHAGFSESLELHQDGSYTRTLHQHLNQPTTPLRGTWRLKGKDLYFEPVPAKLSASSLVQAEAFFYRHKPAFVRTQDLKGDNAHEWWVYERRESGQ